MGRLCKRFLILWLRIILFVNEVCSNNILILLEGLNEELFKFNIVLLINLENCKFIVFLKIGLMLCRKLFLFEGRIFLVFLVKR